MDYGTLLKRLRRFLTKNSKKRDRMSGIYYYIWYEESMNMHAIITHELEDIYHNLGCNWLLMDLQPSLFSSYNGKYLPAFKHVINTCKELGLKIMPIPHIGSGMLPPDWFNQHPNSMALDKNGKPAIMEDTGICISYYSRDALEKLNEHTKFILNFCRDVNYSIDGHRIVEIMEDVGYPRHVDTDYNKWAKYPKTIAVSNFVGNLIEYTYSLGNYMCIFKAFRDAQPFHNCLSNMGLDYNKLIEIADGQIETISPFPQANDECKPDYENVKKGLDLLFSITQDKLTFCTVLCERYSFDPAKQLELILKYPYKDIVWFNYNEGITVDTDLKSNQEKRHEIIKLIKEYNL